MTRETGDWKVARTSIRDDVAELRIVETFAEGVIEPVTLGVELSPGCEKIFRLRFMLILFAQILASLLRRL